MIYEKLFILARNQQMKLRQLRQLFNETESLMYSGSLNQNKN